MAEAGTSLLLSRVEGRGPEGAGTKITAGRTVLLV